MKKTARLLIPIITFAAAITGGYSPWYAQGIGSETGSLSGNQRISISMPTDGLAQKTPPAPMEKLSGGDVSLLNEKMQSYQPQVSGILKNDAPVFYYYQQLDPLSKQIYDVMFQIAQDPTTSDNIGLMMTDQDPETDGFYEKFYISWCSLCYDHPELYWLYSSTTSSEDCPFRFGSDMVVMNGLYYVYIQLMAPAGVQDFPM